MSNSSQPIEAQWVVDLRNDARLGKELVAVLMNHCAERGNTEGAVETLQRIIQERTHLRMQIGYLAAEMQIAGDKRSTPEIVEGAATATA